MEIVLDVMGPESEAREEVAGEPLELVLRRIADDAKRRYILPVEADEDPAIAAEEGEIVDLMPNPYSSQYEL